MKPLTISLLKKAYLSNQYFQFRQFTIQQDKSSMKVCTDSCLFGAWVADKLEKKRICAGSILDIGAGTGLLALMLAQKSRQHIDAVELEKSACEQTMENFAGSKWSERLRIFEADISKWKAPDKYELVISNPPFYQAGLRSENKGKNLAKHDEGLTFQQLLNAVRRVLSNEGVLAVLLPFRHHEHFKKLAAAAGLFVLEEMLVKQTPRHTFFRAMLLFTTTPSAFSTGELVIKDNDGTYTNAFSRLLADYYL